MGPLNNVEVSGLDTLSFSKISGEIIYHSCSSSTNKEDVWLAIVIGVTIIAGLLIIGYFVYKSVAVVQNAKLSEHTSRQAYELEKLVKEAEIKTSADQFNANRTREQREWISETDRIKNEGERLDIRLKEAKINAEISRLDNSRELSSETDKIQLEYKKLDLKLKEAEIKDKIISLKKSDDSSDEQIKS